jgi:putative nucleotidyltransferase with HDIG domain
MEIIDLIKTGINNLPTLPAVYANLSKAIEDPKSSREKIAQIISTDQASAFKILKVANSPFFGFRGRIDTISQAIFLLGFNEVKNIIFALSVINFFSKFRPMDFWAHSIGVGIATRMIGSAIGEKDLENYFLAGILHDIGKLLFFEFTPQEYLKVLEIVEKKKCLIREAEDSVFGIDHSTAGKLLAEKWKMPQGIQDTIKYHHTGWVEKENNTIIASVHLGDIIARSLELGYPGDKLIPQPNPKIWEMLKLPQGFISIMSKGLQEEYNDMVKLMLVV